MKTKISLLLLLAVLAAASVGVAQNVIAVQSGSTNTFYTNLDTAIAHANNGDYIYVPGGNFSLNTNIDKCLHIFGVGHNPDSTVATNPTNIYTANFSLITGADGGSLMGVKLSGGFNFGTFTGNGNITNYTVGRCYITGDISAIGVNSPSNILFYENIVTGAIYLSTAQSNIIYNNIICGLVHSGTLNSIKNNVFLYGGGFNTLMTNTYSTFENNVFLAPSSSTTFSGSTTNNVFNNNLFVDGMVWPVLTNTGINNIFAQSQSSIWVNQSGNTFGYLQDYRIQNTSPGHNAGRDGTDVGIYGGTTFPWKTGSVPVNPHVQYKTISGSTNTNGDLPVNIQVGAQDH